jgi:hypothetical protein
MVRLARQKLVRETRAEQEDEGAKKIARCPMPPLSLDAIAYERQDEGYQEYERCGCAPGRYPPPALAPSALVCRIVCHGLSVHA